MQSILAKIYTRIHSARKISFNRADIIFKGILLLAGLLIVLLAIDGYTFWSIRREASEVANPLIRRSVPLTEEEINEVLNLLDEQNQSLQEILGSR